MYTGLQAGKGEANTGIHIRLDGFVNKSIAEKWKQLVAMADLYRKIHPESPDAQQLLLEWMVTIALHTFSTYSNTRQGG